MRYRLKLATWTVVREPGESSPRVLSDPAAVARLAQDLFKDTDDDREYFWSILLNAQNHSLLTHLVSVGTQSSALVHPRELFGPALREGAASVIVVHCLPGAEITHHLFAKKTQLRAQGPPLSLRACSCRV